MIRSTREGKVAVVTIDAPESRNALTLDLSARLSEAVAEAERDENIHALVVTGTPPAFCAGADLSALGAAKEAGLRAIYDGFLSVARCTLPTIAAVGGAAVGAGLNLALAADVRIVGPRAKFIPRFLELGLHPGGGMTWMSQHLVGYQRTAAMTLFGQSLGAQEAVDAGLALKLVDGDHSDLVNAALTFAKPATEAPRELVLATKKTLGITRKLSQHADAVDVEIEPQIASLESAAFAERLAVVKARIREH
ncbi:enoyl-CoA hydratase [Amycolatopsis sp. NPDC059657]|uniref:enoyl-CoA hydratase n=1 Tax=Amycolatopsis sp. NPDC059657 TaxID=3346899 RepID=UPI003672A918